MGLEKEFFGYVMECDSCSNFINLDTYEDFNGAIAMAKDHGWKMEKVDDEWIHTCPVCAEKRRHLEGDG